MPTTDDIGFDPLSAEFAADPYAIYDRLRAADEPTYWPDNDMWLLSRFEDVSAIARNPAMERSLDGIESPEDARARQIKANWHDMPFHERVVQFSLLDSNGETHRRLRRQVFGEFTTTAVAGYAPVIQTFVNTLLDTLQDREEIDFISDFAAHVPGYVIGHLLGAPTEDAAQLRLWSEQVVQFFDVDRSDARKQLAETATRDFYHYLADLRADRMRAPKDDLITKMIADAERGIYSDDEFISTCMLILMAGHGSTIDVLGSGMHTLLQRPDVLEGLRANPDILPTAIQEMFRFEPPLPFFHRHATERVSLRGHNFPEGTTFGLLYGAANRDPEAFDNPSIFDPSRTPNRHLAFGLGAHLCLGNNLARLNMQIIFSSILARFSRLSLASDIVMYKRGLSVRGPSALALAWRQ